MFNWLRFIVPLFCVVGVLAPQPLSAQTTTYESLESITPPGLPTGWSTTGTWLTATGAYSFVGDVGSNTFHATVTQSQTNSGRLVYGPLSIDNNFFVDGFVRLGAGHVATPPQLSIKISEGDADAGFTNVVGIVNLAETNRWYHFSFSTIYSNIHPDWIGRTNIWVGYEFSSSSNAAVQLDNILLGRGLIEKEPEPFLEGFLTSLWAGVATSGGTKPVALSNNAPSSIGGSVGYLSTGIDRQARLYHRNLLANNGRENVRVRMTTYNESSSLHEDQIYIVVTTNDWAQTMIVGNKFLRYVAEEPSHTWINQGQIAYIPGLGETTNVQVGLLFQTTTAGSSKYTIIDELSFDFIVDVGLSPPLLFSDDQASNQFASIDFLSTNLYLGALVQPRPASAVSNLVVTIHYWTDDGVVSNEATMTPVPGSSYYISPLNEAPLEAGQVLRYAASLRFDSEDGTNEYRRAPLSGSVSTVVARVGTVWINEVWVGALPGQQFLELAAPGGRSVTNWSIEVVDFALNSTSTVSGVNHAFANNSNGYGFWVVGGSGVSGRDATLSFALPVSGGIRLLNSAGLVEDSIAYNVPSAQAGYRVTVTNAGSVYGLRGYAPYILENWTLFATNFSASVLTSATVRLVNDNQGFLLPASLVAATEVFDAIDSNSVAYASVTFNAMFNGGTITAPRAADASGVVTGTVMQGFHDSTNVSLETRALAFGYAVSSVVQVAQTGLSVTNQSSVYLLPGPAADNFNTSELQQFWAVLKRQANSVDWTNVVSGGVSGSGLLRFANASAFSTNRSSTIYAKNGIRSLGAQVAMLTFAVKNESVTQKDYVRAALATNQIAFETNGVFKYFPPVYHWNASAPTGWLRHTFRWRSPSLAGSEFTWFGIQGMPAVNAGPGKNIDIDELELVLGHDVQLANFELRPGGLRADRPHAVSVDLVPWGDAINQVMPRFHYRRDGVWTNLNMLSAPVTLTNTLNVVLTNVLSGLLEGESISYYVSTSFEGVSTNFSVTYYPDNYVLDPTTGVDVAIGGYQAVPVNALVQGVGNVWFNEIQPNISGSATNHFIELGGVQNFSIGSWRLEVFNLTNNQRTASYVFPAAAAITSGAQNGFALYTVGGSGISARNQLLTNGLPRAGGLKLYDNASNLLYAVSYDASASPVASSYTSYEYLGNAGAGSDSLSATGTGNPANTNYTYEAMSPTPGAFNSGQSTVNTAPRPDPALYVNADWVLATNRIEGRALAAADLDKPILYRLTGPGVTNEWSTNRLVIATNLSDNTAYTFTVQSRDALTNQTAVGSTNLYTLVIPPGAPVIAGLATNALRVSASVNGLGTGQTALRFNNVDGVLTEGPYVAGGEWGVTNTALAPNRSYRFTAQARNGDGTASAYGTNIGTGFTLAATPNVAPTLVQTSIFLRVFVTNLFFNAFENADGNPTNTEYAVATWVEGSGTTNYLSTNGTVQTSAVWAVLSRWVVTNGLSAGVDKSKTNAFAMLARNGQAVPTALGPSSNLAFQFSLNFIAAETRQLTNGSGTARVGVEVVNPLNGTNVCLRLQYSTNAGSSWANATLSSIVTPASASLTPVTNEVDGSVYQISRLSTAFATNSLIAIWNAAADVGTNWANPVALTWRAFEPGGLSPSPVITNAIMVDVQRPVVTNFSTTATDFFSTSTLTGQVDFSEAVTGFTPDDLTVVNGLVTNLSGSGANYTFVIVPNAPSGQGTVTVSIAQGRVTDAYGNSNVADPGFSRVYDTMPPSLVFSSSVGSYFNTSNFVIQARFSEPITGFESDDLVITNASLVSFTPVSATNVQLSMRALTEGLVHVSVSSNRYLDLAGNPNAGSTVTQMIYDATAPAGELTRLTTPFTNNFASVQFGLVFNEPVTGLVAEDVSVVAGGSLAFTNRQLVMNEGQTNFTLTLNGLIGQGALTASLSAGACADLAGNSNLAVAGVGYFIDRVLPTGTLSRAAGVAPTNNLASVDFVLEFDKPVTGLVASAFAVTTNGSLQYASRALSPATGPTNRYTFTISGLTGVGRLGVTLPAEVCGDAAGNPNMAVAEAFCFVDRVAPTGTLTRTSSPLTNNLSSVSYNLAFSETVTGLVAGAFSVQASGLTHTNVALSGSGSSYNVTISGVTGDGTLSLSLPANSAWDVAGNASLAVTGAAYRIDRVSPTGELTRLTTPFTNNFASVQYGIIFNEPVTGLVADDFTVIAGGSLVFTNRALAAVSGQTNYTLTITGLSGQGSLTASLPGAACTDLVGNTNIPVAGVSYLVDRILPTGTLSRAAGMAPTNNLASVDFVLEFDKPVTGLVASAFAVTTNGSLQYASRLLSPATGPTNRYTFTISGLSGMGRLGATLPAEVCGDAAGNPNVAVAEAFCFVDRVAPSVGLSANVTNVFSNETFMVTARFSEAVTNFVTTNAIQLTNATSSPPVQVSSSNYTFTVRPSGQGAVTVSLAAGAGRDQVGNESGASTNTLSLIYDSLAPVVGLSATVTNAFSNQTFTVTARFSESVTNFVTTNAIQLTNATSSPPTQVSGSNYTFTVRPSGQGSVTVSLLSGAGRDQASNPSVASTNTLSLTHDSIGPVVSNWGIDVGSQTNQPGYALTGWTVRITFDLSEAAKSNPVVRVNATNNATYVTNTGLAYSYDYLVRAGDNTTQFPTGRMANIGVDVRDVLGNRTEVINTNLLMIGGRRPFPGPGPHPIPGRIEAENYDFGGQGVSYLDAEPSNPPGKFENKGGAYRLLDYIDVGELGPGTNVVGWAFEGEWMEYTVSIARTGTYSLIVRSATESTGCFFAISFASGGITNALTGNLLLPYPGGFYSSYQESTYTNIFLPVGEHIMRVSMSKSGNTNKFIGNFDYFEWRSEAPIVTNLLSVGVNNTNGGVVSTSGGWFEAGTTQSVTAVANTNHFFAGWTGDVVSTNNPLPVVITTNVSIIAVFMPHTNFLTVGVNRPDRGSVVPASAWYMRGSSVTVTASPSAYYFFTGWTGSFVNASNPLEVVMSSDIQLTANFAEVLFTNGVPQWWLASFGLGTNEAAALQDPDNDKKLNWEEYIAGTDPINHLSVFAITNNRVVSGGMIVSWPTVTGRLYSLSRGTNLIAQSYSIILLTNAPPSQNTYTDSLNGAQSPGFYQIKVRKE